MKKSMDRCGKKLDTVEDRIRELKIVRIKYIEL